MRTTHSSATEYFRRLVDARVFQTLDQCWNEFADYLRGRAPSFPAAKVVFFHGACGPELMSVIDRWVKKGVAKLLNADSNDPDSAFFCEFDRNPNVLEEVRGFIESQGYAHLFD